MLCERLTIIGIGLIGGSLARAVRRGRLAGSITACSPDPEELARARALGIVDNTATDPAAAVAGAQLVVVAVPVRAMDAVFAAIAPALAPDAVVTDAGSTKLSVIEAARAQLGPHFSRFVGAHPIAGTEASGVDAGFDSLFDDRVAVLTPLAETDAGAIALVEHLWRGVGARPERLAPALHDEILAATSHLPHLLAFTLVDELARHRDARALFRYAAGGFRDFTRIASSNPLMWADIAIANRDALLREVHGYIAALSAVAADLDRGDHAALVAAFSRARDARNTCLPALAGRPEGAA